MISFVTWKWSPPPGYRSSFGPDTVNVLRAMIARHYHDRHRFICVTDDAAGLDAGIDVVPMFHEFADLPSPHGGKNPSCYRRLRAFAPDIGRWFGERFLMIDLDVVITGDLRPIVDRPEDFVIWGDTSPHTFYNGGLMLMTAGARRQVWETFDPRTSPQLSKNARQFGSDQGWIGYCLGPGEAKWNRKDGVYSFRNDLAPQRHLPDNARIVLFHGRHDPWTDYVQLTYPWVSQHYRRGQEAAA